MASFSRSSLQTIAKVPLGLMWLVIYPFRLLNRIVARISGSARKYEEQRSLFQGRDPMDEQAFLALSHSAPEDAPIWLALRRATAECCRVSEAVIYPTDDLACLRLIMVPGSDANWLNLTPNWLDVMVRTELSLGISLVSCQLDKVWAKAEANGELGSLTQLGEMIIRFFRDRGEWPTSKRLEQ